MSTYTSQWIKSCPVETECTNYKCQASIHIGDICVQHYNEPLYGCFKCASNPKIAAVWAGPIPDMIKDLAIFKTLQPPEDAITVPKAVEKTKIKLISFGYKYGKPDITAMDFLIDVRHKVRNPWRNVALRKLNGLHPDVQRFVAQCSGFEWVKGEIVCRLYHDKIYIGCHGGKDRSVAIAEMMGEWIRKNDESMDVIVEHRDLK